MQTFVEIRVVLKSSYWTSLNEGIVQFKQSWNVKINVGMQGETQNSLEFIYTKLCISFYMFKLQSLSKYSPFDAIHLLRHFFPLLKRVFKLIDFDAFYCFCCFLFHHFHIGKSFLSRMFFFWGNKR